MSILEKIDKLSFAQVISISFFLAMVFAIPTTVFLVQQQTRLGSKAYQKPKLISIKEILPPGPIPSAAPKIGRVFPWVGKIGDIVWIQGENFGNNPAKKRLIIGGVTVLEDYITSWHDNEIQAIIPQGAKQGGLVEVRVGQHPVSASLPYVIYDRETKIKLTKKDNLISALNGQSIDKAKVWLGDEKIPTEALEIPSIAALEGETPIFDTTGKPILTILLYDRAGQVLPYYVDPIEFGF